MTQPETHTLEFPVSILPPFARAWVSVSAHYGGGCVTFHFLITKMRVPAGESSREGNRVYFDDTATVTVQKVRDLARLLCKVSGMHEPNFDAQSWRALQDQAGDKCAHDPLPGAPPPRGLYL